jgi:SP family facilitated glucose transporter-like MFS transporter 8
MLWESREALSIGIAMMFFQQFSGINAVIFFQNSIFMEAGISWYNEAAAVTMVVQVVFTALSVWLMDRAGRKPLLLAAFIGMACSATAIAAFFQLQTAGQLPVATWLVLAGCFGYIASFSIGAGSVPWLLMAEIFPDDVRGSACAIVGQTNWFFSFLITMAVGPVRAALGWRGLFSFYAGVCSASVIYIWRRLPETKGRSFAEITASLTLARKESQKLI